MDIGELLGAALVVGFVVWLANLECIATHRAMESKTGRGPERKRPQAGIAVDRHAE